jgi:uncharacterized protein YdcH (DUF465 family)
MPFVGPLADRARNEVSRFQNLEKAHREYDDELQGIECLRHLTPELEVRRAQLKKLKLHAKDEMQAIIASL